MRAICLALVLLFAAPAAMAEEPEFFKQLAARGPQDLRVSEGLVGPLTGAWGRASVEQGKLVIEISRGGEREVFRYDGLPLDRNGVWSDATPRPDLGDYCGGGGNGGFYEVHCYSRSDLMSRALRPPHTIWKLWLAADGLRVVKESRLERVTLTPRSPAPKADRRWLDPGLASNLGDALAQLAAHEKGYLYGGASGGGEWYGSDLYVRDVKGLDFKLERTVSPDRGGRSSEAPATWSFDYQGPDAKDPAVLTWFMHRYRKGAGEADFWCVGRHNSGAVDIACHKGGKPSDVRGKADVAFKLEPFPKWKIYVEAGSDNAFSSVGSTRLETLPFP